MGSKFFKVIIVFVVGLVLNMMPQLVHAQKNAQQVLIEQGEYWGERGDINRAIEAWNKLLLIDKNNALALKGLVKMYIKRSELQKAQTYLSQLEQFHPADTSIPELEQSLRLQTNNETDLLEEARLLAASGELDEALSKYEDVFKDHLPQGALGREYYGYLGYSDGGLADAIEGLERLEDQQSEDPQLALVLARHLARQESSRLEGVKRLQTLSQRQDIGSDAAESWRDALIWLGPPTKELELYFTAYLKQYPDDEEILAQLQKGKTIRSIPTKTPQQIDQLTQRTQAALRNLDKDERQSENEFLAVLRQRPNDTNALGGLGVIRFRQGRLIEARDFLHKARRNNPKGWDDALRQVETALALRSAQQKAKENEFSEAERIYRNILNSDKNNITALNGITDLLIKQKRLDQATIYFNQLEKQLGNSNANAQAQYALTVAKYYEAKGDNLRSKAELELALNRFPSDPWIRLELAKRELGQNRSVANHLMSVLGTDNSLDAFKARALYAAALQDWDQVILLINQFPTETENEEFNTLLQQAKMHQKVEAVLGFCERGAYKEAMSTLQGLKPLISSDFSLIAQAVQAYNLCGATDRAMNLINEALTLAQEVGKEDSDLLLLQAGLFLQAQNRPMIETILRTLKMRSLSPTQQKTYDELVLDVLLQEANNLLENGHAQAAKNLLVPLKNSHPDYVSLNSALIKIYIDLGAKKEAMELFRALTAKGSHQQLNTNDTLVIAQLAYRLGEKNQAEQLLEELAAQNPTSIPLLVNIAKTYRHLGSTKRAAIFIQRAMDLQIESEGLAYRELLSR